MRKYIAEVCRDEYLTWAKLAVVHGGGGIDWGEYSLGDQESSCHQKGIFLLFCLLEFDGNVVVFNLKREVFGKWKVVCGSHNRW